MKLGIGIDTGGTFTDCVVMEFEEGRILSKAKSPTTHGNLRVGIGNALSEATRHEAFRIEDVCAVSLSTTLATNALIEGKGAAVASLLIGIELDRLLPSEYKRTVRGGHSMAADGGIIETAPLDEEAILSFCEEIRERVAAVAITESFGTLCPEHELRAKSIIGESLDVPVTCGHELTRELGFFERAVTAALNSSLIPVLSTFMKAIEEELKLRGIKAPIYLVRSDGTITSSEVAKERPAETVLTGPAASVIGARYLTGLKDMVVVDQGGTTCLTSIVRNGWPTIDEKGATIASYRTRIRAMRIRAVGLGGDSQVLMESGRIIVGPNRVIPLCVASISNPILKEKIKETGSVRFLILLDQMEASKGKESAVVNSLKAIQPATIEELMKKTGLAKTSVETVVRQLSNDRVVFEVGLTATDILHWKKVYTAYDREAALLGIRAIASRVGLAEEEFVARVEKEILDRMCEEIVLTHMEEFQELQSENNQILKALLNKHEEDLHIEAFSNRPIVAAGACSYAFIPRVAETMHTNFFVSEHSDVCNAIGCIVGAIVERAIVTIRRSSMASLDYGSTAEGGFQVLFPGKSQSFGTKDAAVEEAKRIAMDEVRARATRSGANDITVTVEIEERTLPVRKDWSGGATDDIWVSAEVVAVAVGRPYYWLS